LKLSLAFVMKNGDKFRPCDLATKVLLLD
jgi:hypothetical protein